MEIDRLKVLVAKPGLDGHDRGAKIIARSLIEANIQVIYTGIRQTPEMIAESALQQDVDILGISILSGAHMELFPEIFNALKARGLDDLIVIAGGIIPDSDREALIELGVLAIFGPGTPTSEILRFMQCSAQKKREYKS